MKNLNYFPFERNHYYYGKLLSVEDFELEQRYMNNKRRLMNRFFYGMGVVFGMNVIQADDRTICVQPGYALDFAGREMILETGITKQLVNISGFESIKETKAPYAYLCVEYDEEKNEIVYNAAGDDRLSEGNEFNKYKETCRLFLSCKEPENIGELSSARIYERREVIYFGNGIRISQVLPKYLKAGEECNLVVEVENLGQQQKFGFSYELKLKHLKYKNSPKLKIDFDENLMDKAFTYRMTYPLMAQEGVEGHASAQVVENKIKLVLMNEVSSESAKGVSETYITACDAVHGAEADFRETQMNYIMNQSGVQQLYLARIHLVQEGNVYVIAHMEPMPFKQYLPSAGLNSLYHNAMGREVSKLKETINQINQEALQDKGTIAGNSQVAYGVYELSVDSNKQLAPAKQKVRQYYSEELAHGLGLGEVNIMLGLSGGQGEVIWGCSGIFDSVPRMELAAKVFQEKGTFIIGARLTEAGKAGKYNIYWRAERNPQYIEADNNEKAIVVNPNFINLYVRETVYIDARCRNMNDKRLRWDVEKSGGIIDKNGMYTAPDQAGIYQINVSSFVYPEVSTVVYAVVRKQLKEEDADAD